MWVRSLGQEDPLEEDMAIHFSILAWRIPMDRGAWRARVYVVTMSWTQLSDLACTHTNLMRRVIVLPPVVVTFMCELKLDSNTQLLVAVKVTF